LRLFEGVGHEPLAHRWRMKNVPHRRGTEAAEAETGNSSALSASLW